MVITDVLRKRAVYHQPIRTTLSGCYITSLLTSSKITREWISRSASDTSIHYRYMTRKYVSIMETGSSIMVE